MDLLNDSIFLIFLWIVTMLFYFLIFPKIRQQVVKREKLSPSKSLSPPGQQSPFLSPLPLPGKKHSARLERELLTEVCCKAKAAYKHPSYPGLCLDLVHHYGLDINRPALSNSFTIFHCCCLSGSSLLVETLLPKARLELRTDKGDTPLHLAVYATAHRANKGKSRPGCKVLIFSRNHFFYCNIVRCPRNLGNYKVVKVCRDFKDLKMS